MIIIRFDVVWMGGKFTLFKRENPIRERVFSGVKLCTIVDCAGAAGRRLFGGIGGACGARCEKIPCIFNALFITFPLHSLVQLMPTVNLQ